MKIDIYKRIFEVLKEDIVNSGLEIELRPAQWETIAEVITDEVKNILEEDRAIFINRIEEILHND
jgi:hypothetical protein